MCLGVQKIYPDWRWSELILTVALKPAARQLELEFAKFGYFWEFEFPNIRKVTIRIFEFLTNFFSSFIKLFLVSFWYFFLPKIGLYWQNLNFLSFSLAKFEIFELFLAFFDEIWIFWSPELKIYAFWGSQTAQKFHFLRFLTKFELFNTQYFEKNQKFCFFYGQTRLKFFQSTSPS